MNTLKIESETAQALTTTKTATANAANDLYTLTTKDRFSNIRTMIGRSAAASQYSKLTEQQKAIVLFGARIRPSTHINIPLEAMTFEERNQIRLSIIALRNLGKSFGESLLSRDEFNVKPTRKSHT